MNTPPQPQPTPYDITGIPLFPYIPGIVAWTLVSLFALLVVATTVWILYRDRLPHSSRGSRALREFRKELKYLISLQTRDSAARAALLTRRLLTTLSGDHNFSAMANSELAEVLANNPNHRFVLLIRALIHIEEQRFAPPAAQDYKQSLETLEKLADFYNKEQAA